MSEIKDETSEAVIARLNKISAGDVVIFSREEADALREVSIWWRRAKGAMALGGVLGSVAKWALVMGAFLVALKSGLLDSIGGVHK